MSKSKDAVRFVRQQAEEQLRLAIFCKDHNFSLQQEYHVSMEKKLTYIANRLEDILGTDYVSAKQT